MANSIQPTILRQTSADLLYRLFGLPCKLFQVLLEFLFGDFDILLLRDLIQDQSCADFAKRALTLTCAQAVQIHTLHVFGAHSLSRQGAQSPLQTNIDLIID